MLLKKAQHPFKLMLVVFMAIALSACQQPPSDQSTELSFEQRLKKWQQKNLDWFLSLFSGDLQPEIPPHIYPAISSDGKMIAVLSHADPYHVAMRLRYKRIDPPGPWQELSIPTHVDSIRFGLKGYELLLTRRSRPQVDSWSELYKIDLADPNKAPQTIYEAYGLKYPTEVTPGEIFAMNCATTSDNQCHNRLGAQWNLIRNGKLIREWTYGAQYGNMNYGWPNVVPGQGAFWLKIGGYYKEGDTFPSFWAFAFPGSASAPQMNMPLDVGTVDLDCDYKMDRCLRVHLQNAYAMDKVGHPTTSDRGTFTYIAGVVYRNENCLVQDIAGFIWDKSITPDGRAAVVAVGPRGSTQNSPHVAVIKFEAGQCLPKSVQHFYFEEQ